MTFSKHVSDHTILQLPPIVHIIKPTVLRNANLICVTSNAPASFLLCLCFWATQAFGFLGVLWFFRPQSGPQNTGMGPVQKTSFQDPWGNINFLKSAQWFLQDHWPLVMSTFGPSFQYKWSWLGDLIIAHSFDWNALPSVCNLFNYLSCRFHHKYHFYKEVFPEIPLLFIKLVHQDQFPLQCAFNILSQFEITCVAVIILLISIFSKP